MTKIIDILLDIELSDSPGLHPDYDGAWADRARKLDSVAARFRLAYAHHPFCPFQLKDADKLPEGFHDAFEAYLRSVIRAERQRQLVAELLDLCDPTATTQ